MKISTLIFDFDGTLIDTLKPAEKIIQILAKEFHREELLKKYSVDYLRGKTLRELKRLFRIRLYQMPALVRRSRQLFMGEINQVNFFPGTINILRKLKQDGYHLGILSSNSKENIDKVLKLNQITHFFDFVYSESTIFSKSRSLRLILKKQNLACEEVVYIGDEVRDIEACKTIGIKMIAVGWGLNTKKVLLKFKPEYLIDKPEEIINVLQTR